jgi:uncharacterized membrane protein YfcA
MLSDMLFHPSVFNWLIILLSAFIAGLNKAGLKGLDMLNITVMVLVFGSKASTGVVLPLLCAADVMAVLYYHRHAEWKHFWKLIPWMAAGIIIGVLIGKDMNEAIFRKIMALIILLTVVIILVMEFRKTTSVPDNKLFVAGTGLIAGFTTMFGNLAGAFSSVYFLAMRMPKNIFIGTAAWVFLVINFFKLPFQIFSWHNINADTLLIDLYLLPALIAGFWTGIKLVSVIKDDSYRKVVILLTMIGAIFIFLK